MFIRCKTADGYPIAINVDQILSYEPKDGGTLITQSVGGLAVIEDFATVDRMITAASK